MHGDAGLDPTAEKVPERSHQSATPAWGDLPLVFTWEYHFKHSVQEVWAFVTHTDRLNRAVGLSPIKYRETPDPRGGSFRHGTSQELGLPLHWLEHPYEWLLYRYFMNERSYTQGPLKRLVSHWQFTAEPEGCILQQTIAVDPANPATGVLARYRVGVTLRNQYLAAYAHIDDYLAKKVELPFSSAGLEAFKPPVNLREQILEKLEVAGVGPDLSRRAVELVLKADDNDLLRIRPIRLARQWRLEPRQVLSLLLRGTKAGVFTMQWDLLCPNCRGAKEQRANLSDVSTHASCESCNISYEIDFEKSVELTFGIHPGLRPIEIAEYCVGGPQNTPHYMTQFRVLANQSRGGRMRLADGVFMARSPHSKTRYKLTVSATAPANTPLEFVFAQSEAQVIELSLAPGDYDFSMRNTDTAEILVMFERAAWLEDACTAAYITSLQEFRDLFSTQVLRAGDNFSVGAMTLLFTDLKGSTALYERIGDARAYSLVSAHFAILMQEVKDHEGCVVKTIGDAVMAAFSRPEMAVQAALRIQQRLRTHNEQAAQEALILKIGLHYGPCLAVNVNDRLDYFGSVVNIAARTEGQCQGGDVVISSALYWQPGVAGVIDASKVTCERFVGTLKGVQGPIELMRLR